MIRQSHPRVSLFNNSLTGHYPRIKELKFLILGFKANLKLSIWGEQ